MRRNNLGIFAGGVAVLLAALAARAQTRTWNGGAGTDKWSEADNWGGTAPVPGDALVFGGTARCTNVNDLAADFAVNGLTFNSGAALFSLSGARLTLNGNVTNNDNDSHRVNLDLALPATRTFSTASGNLFLNGALSGAGGVTKSGANVLVLAGDNSYAGDTTINSGVVRLTRATGLGSTNGITVVASDGPRLELDNVAVTGQTIRITGMGGNNIGALQAFAGSNTWAGPVILGSSGARLGVNSPSGMLVVTGPVDDGPNTYALAVRNADNGGPTVLTGQSTYKGETQVVVGRLVLSGGADRLPTNTVVRVGNGSNVAWATLDLNGQDQTVEGILQFGTTMDRKIANWASNQVATLTVNTWKTDYTYSANLDGNLNLTKAGTNTLTLSAATGNNFYGQTLVREGALVLQTPMAIGSSTFNTGDGASGLIGFHTNTVINFGGLIGTNDLVLTNRSGAAVSLRVRGTQSTVFDGTLVGGGDFTKANTGTFTLLQPATYAGRTYVAGGRLVVPHEDVLGPVPASFVADQVIFDGGAFKASSNFTFEVTDRGFTFNAGGGGFDAADFNSILTVHKRLVGAGGLTKYGNGTLLLTASNSYAGVTTVAGGILRLGDARALGTTDGGTVVASGGIVELTDGLTVSGEALSLAGAGFTVTGPPSAPQSNRGALQAGVDATAEWAGPVLLTANQSRVGAQNGGHLVVSGVIDDGAATYQLRTSSNASDRQRGVEFRAQNTYGGSTDLTRGTLFLGVDDAIPAGSVLDVHWADANNAEYAALDLKGYDQTVAGLRNSGNSGANAAVTNSAGALATLTVNQAADLSYGGVIGGPVALVKDGVGRLALTFSTGHTGPTTVRGGTLLLAATNVLSAASAVVLDGGTLDAGEASHTLQSFTVLSDSVLALGAAGAVSVVNQGAEAWSGELELTGTLGSASLRVQPDLTAGQLARIRYDGGAVMQNDAGYIVPYFGTLILVQ